MKVVTYRFGINIGAKNSEVLDSGRWEGDVRIYGIELQRPRMKLMEEFGYLGTVSIGNEKFTQLIERRRAGDT